MSSWSRLPREILDRATLCGNEYAWRIEDIPEVIEATRQASLVNIGGQLQFRIPDVGTCECYWVEVDTYKSVPKSLPWDERVNRTAEVALADFQQLAAKYDFVEEGRRGFDEHLQKIVEGGGNPAEFACFVWYVIDEIDAEAKDL
jgi:hypothetical protein